MSTWGLGLAQPPSVLGQVLVVGSARLCHHLCHLDRRRRSKNVEAGVRKCCRCVHLSSRIYRCPVFRLRLMDLLRKRPRLVSRREREHRPARLPRLSPPGSSAAAGAPSRSPTPSPLSLLGLSAATGVSSSSSTTHQENVALYIVQYSTIHVELERL